METIIKSNNHLKSENSHFFPIAFLLLTLLLGSCAGNEHDSTLVKVPEKGGEIADSTINVEEVYRDESILVEVAQSGSELRLVQITDKRGLTKFDVERHHIPVKTIEYMWKSESNLCLITWYSQWQSRYLFIPLYAEVQLQYFDKTILTSDSVNNLICYFDKENEVRNTAEYVIRDLITGDETRAELIISEANANPPYVYEVKFNETNIEFNSGVEIKRMAIKGLVEGIKLKPQDDSVMIASFEDFRTALINGDCAKLKDVCHFPIQGDIGLARLLGENDPNIGRKMQFHNYEINQELLLEYCAFLDSVELRVLRNFRIDGSDPGIEFEGCVYEGHLVYTEGTFLFSVGYMKLIDKMWSEYSLIFNFKWIDGRYKLVSILGAG